MYINQLTPYNRYQNNVTFRGLFEPKGMITKLSGRSYFNKTVVNVYDFIYHPFKGESPEQIKKTIAKNTKGQSFALIETGHFHKDGDYYMLNRIKKGSVIDKESAPDSFSKIANGVKSSDYIFNIYNNFSYGVMDYTELSVGAVRKLLVKFHQLLKS